MRNSVNAVPTEQQECLSVGVDGIERMGHVKLSIYEIFWFYALIQEKDYIRGICTLWCFIKFSFSPCLKGIHSEYSVKYLECGYSGLAQPDALVVSQPGDRVDIWQVDIIYEFQKVLITVSQFLQQTLIKLLMLFLHLHLCLYYVSPSPC